MKRLSDRDISEMAAGGFVPDSRAVRHSVNRQLRLLARHFPKENIPLPDKVILDLHGMTVEQAWAEIMNLAESGVKNAVIITGASGILKIKFQQWIADSILSPHIKSCVPLNNGSFQVVFNSPAG